MGQQTKIDWCDASWNPVTGCLHGCGYCYARRIAERFGGGYRHDSEPADRSWRWWRQRPDSDYDSKDLVGDHTYHANGQIHVLEDVCYSYPCKPCISPPEADPSRKKAPYPYYFDPTFHRYRLDEPQKWKRPKNIFVCSMADLFGEWVPMDWKIETLLACREAPQHRYLFLTKNPIGYCLYPTEEHPLKDLPIRYDVADLYTDNMWLGVTYTGNERLPGTLFYPTDWKSRAGTGTNFWYLWRMSGAIFPFTRNKFLSIEPISCDITEVEDERNPGERLLNRFIYGEDRQFRLDGIYKWVIVGAESGNRKGKIIPKKEWIDKLASLCDRSGVPIFMKESLRELMGDDFRQEFPWEV